MASTQLQMDGVVSQANLQQVRSHEHMYYTIQRCKCGRAYLVGCGTLLACMQCCDVSHVALVPFHSCETAQHMSLMRLLLTSCD